MDELSINDVNEAFVYAYDPETDKNFIVKFLTPNSPGELFRMEVIEDEQITDTDKILEAINSIEAAKPKPLWLAAYSDYEEEKYKEWFPGVKIIRIPQRIKINEEEDL